MFDSRCHIFKDYNIPFDEKGATCGVVRKVQWVKADEEPDESKAKLEIRKTYISGGEERNGKGYTFSTDEGPGELAVGLIKCGFGNTKEILRAVRSRDDFLDAAKTIDEDDSLSDDGEIFDMRDLFVKFDEEEEEEVG
jgi:hypothetical protein